MPFSWGLIATMENYILGSRDIFLAQRKFCRRSNLLGGQIAKKMILGCQPPSKSSFLGHLSLAEFAWRVWYFDRQGNSILVYI